MDQLIEAGGAEIIDARIAQELPTLGICVGMQVMFSDGREKSAHKGLGIWPGDVSQLDAPILPHIGWNTVSVGEGSLLFTGVEDERFYFVHSYAAKSAVPDAVNSTANYNENFLAAVETPYVVTTQFHPEKSGAAGLKLIENWVTHWVRA